MSMCRFADESERVFFLSFAISTFHGMHFLDQSSLTSRKKDSWPRIGGRANPHGVNPFQQQIENRGKERVPRKKEPVGQKCSKVPPRTKTTAVTRRAYDREEGEERKVYLAVAAYTNSSRSVMSRQALGFHSTVAAFLPPCDDPPAQEAISGQTGDNKDSIINRTLRVARLALVVCEREDMYMQSIFDCRCIHFLARHTKEQTPRQKTTRKTYPLHPSSFYFLSLHFPSP